MPKLATTRSEARMSRMSSAYPRSAPASNVSSTQALVGGAVATAVGLGACVALGAGVAGVAMCVGAAVGARVGALVGRGVGACVARTGAGATGAVDVTA